MYIANQIALVTGANRGLGLQLARELLSRGAKVYAGARDPQAVDIPGAIPLQLDITDPNS
ncbi:SDR family NAD(P)-dependent oxidoreductase [Paenibacillus sp. yr247]|uniref:SDR family NAD(P)-dependent oxidoreductase n=1 Tax=Paenibacillus sp. yr247 TaxID=1761880 RepID=UPI000B28FD70|nr:SDR family NAD(P)-dependent oxidoreductase [Paenibacillus sp. yr247]